jgi:solute carrier family 9B (sodium/hydrogen exchanger), member 1/2
LQEKKLTFLFQCSSLWDWLGLWPNGEQFARLAAFICIGFLVWGIIFVLLGEDASPFGGQLFMIAALCIVAKLGGWLASRVRLPALLGMLLVGMAAKNLGLIAVHGEYEQVVADIRRVALVIILIRAGLDLDPNATRKLFGTILKLGLIPWLIECCVVAVITYFLLGLPWGWAFMLG